MFNEVINKDHLESILDEQKLMEISAHITVKNVEPYNVLSVHSKTPALFVLLKCADPDMMEQIVLNYRSDKYESDVVDQKLDSFLYNGIYYKYFDADAKHGKGKVLRSLLKNEDIEQIDSFKTKIDKVGSVVVIMMKTYRFIRDISAGTSNGYSRKRKYELAIWCKAFSDDYITMFETPKKMDTAIKETDISR